MFPRLSLLRKPIRFCRSKYVILICSVIFIFAFFLWSKCKVPFKHGNKSISKFTLSQAILRHDIDSSEFVSLISKLPFAKFQMVLLDADALTQYKTNGKFGAVGTFGIFEEDIDQFRKWHSQHLDPEWSLVEVWSKDYRLMRPNKTASVDAKIIGHHFLVSTSCILHVAVILNRNRYFWIAGLERPYLPSEYKFLANMTYDIPLPMAVDAFNCTSISISHNPKIEICVPEKLDYYLWQIPRARFFECHYDEIVYPFFEKYNNTAPVIETKEQKLTIQEIYRITKMLRIPAIIFAGSMLGWYRQCGYIITSSDADVAVLAEDFDESLLHKLFQSEILALCCRYGSPELGLEYRTHTRKNAFWLDVFLLYHGTPGQLLSYMWGAESLYKFTYPTWNGICSAEFFGILVYVPCNYAEVVLADFGRKNWFDPNMGFGHVNWGKGRVYETGEADVMKHGFNKVDCQKPDVMWGCDPVPPNVLNSTFYRNYTDSIRKEIV